ncbi:MAG: YihY/virulence factor BrkB family protein, partial [Myxococcota bacterium]|nr:YihY/virulence factor BrkB family protein [Myxococcota bacterium]
MTRAKAAATRAIFDLDDSQLSPPRRALVLVVRLVWLTVGGFFRERLQMRAASLAFATVLAIVPAAALAFAVADALGMTDLLIDDTIEPFLADMLGDAEDPALPPGVQGLRSTIDSLLSLVRATHVAGLGVAGFAGVMIALARVLRGVEEAFAHVFEHRGPPRTLARRGRAFAVVVLTTPIGMSYAITSAVLSHDTAAGRWVTSIIPFAPLRDLFLTVLPPVMVMLALLVLYLELPDAEIRPRSALLGAALAAIAWYGLQLLHIRFQLGIARYNAIYSGFGAFPILLLSIQLSWVIVLLGAQVIAAHQNAPSLRQLTRGAVRDHAERQALAVRASIELARAAS